MIGALVGLQLITLHMVDGRTVAINPAAVQQLIHPHEPSRHRLLVPGVNCAIRLAGSYVSVKETCEQVQQMLEGGTP
jgi:hypothetical protein